LNSSGEGSSVDQRVHKARKLGFGFGSPGQKRHKKVGLAPGFNPEVEENPMIRPKKKKLVPLDPIKSDEQVRKEKEDEARSIVSLIPTEKEELFAYNMNWSIIDEAAIGVSKIKPWITKKIVEYLGEEEPTLIQFILDKIAEHIAPAEILKQLQFVLEDEAEVFIFKLWRMLIFEMLRAQKEKERVQQTSEQVQ